MFDNSEDATDALAMSLVRVLKFCRVRIFKRWDRVLPFGDYISSRGEKAQFLGWGEGSTCYDGSLVLGDVKVGLNVWVGPWTVLDGSGGGLTIGDNCSISAGVHIYTHNSVKWAVTGGEAPYAKAPTRIGNNCFLGPNAVIAAGVTIGDGAVVGACSFVNKDVPAGATVVGNPANITRAPAGAVST